MALEKILKNSSGVPTGEYETVAGGTNFSDNPIGTILPFGGTNIPQGWKYCDGSELSKTEYADLYAVIGDSFKGNKTPTTGYFCLPDLRECTLKGASDTNNNTYTIGTHQKIAVGEFIDDRIQRHAHMYNLATGSGTTWIAAQKEANIIQEITTGPVAEYGTGDTIRKGATTEVKSVGVNYIIKAKMVAMPSDFMSKVDEAVEEKFEVEDLSSQISSTVASGMLCYKCGKTVTLVLSNVLVSSNGQITGVPKNANIATGALIASDASASAYLSTGAIGNNYININIGASNKLYYGSITYFTND